MSFVVELVLLGDNYPTVPELSLQWRKGESYVWIVRDNKAEKVLIRAVKRLNSIILVDGDLKPDELVVVEGVQRLRAGSEVVHAAPKPPAEQSGESARTIDPQKG